MPAADPTPSETSPALAAPRASAALCAGVGQRLLLAAVLLAALWAAVRWALSA